MIESRFSTQARWLWMLSIETPISLQLRVSNSLLRFASSHSSVEHTGVKSAGCENRTAQLLPCHSENCSSPCVVTALKSGAGSEMRGSERVLSRSPAFGVVEEDAVHMVWFSFVRGGPAIRARGSAPCHASLLERIHAARRRGSRCRRRSEERRVGKGG